MAGRPLKFEGTKPARVNVYMHPALLKWVRAQAKNASMTIGDWISHLVTEKKQMPDTVAHKERA